MITKGKKPSKLRTLVFLCLSLLAVSVTAVSTAAWFQIASAGSSVTDDVSVSAGSSGLTIDSVNAYKSAYDQIDSETTDYSSSHVIGYNVKGTAASTNINQGPVTGFDVPIEGVGYYLVGDEIWATATMGMDEGESWKYSSSKRFSDSALGDNNYGIIKNVYLKEDTQIKVRRHYFVSSDMTDWWINAAIDDNEYTATALDINDDGNIVVNSGQSGYYNLYLLKDNWKISVYPLALDSDITPSPQQNSNIAGGPNVKKTATTGSGNKSVTEIVTDDNAGAGCVIISIENIGFSSGYSHETFRAFLTAEYGAKQTYTYSSNTDMPTTAGWSYLDTEYKYLVCPTGAVDFHFYFPEWVEYCGYKIVGNKYYNWFGPIYFRKTANGNEAAWGYGKEIDNEIYDDSGWKIRAVAGDDASKDWGSATITKKASYVNLGNATRQVTDISTETVSKYYIFDSPTTPSLSGYEWQQGGWYTDSGLSANNSLGTAFITGDLTIYTAFKRLTYFQIYVYKRKHDNTETVMSDYNGIERSDYTDTHYDPNITPSATGYSTWGGTWYKSREDGTPPTYGSVYGSSDVGSTDSSSRTVLYTYISEIVGTMTVTKKYLSTDHASLTKTGGSKTGITYYGDTAFTMSSLNSLEADDDKNLNVSDDDEYRFLGYSTTATGDSGLISDSARTFTTATTTLYSLFVPKGPHTLYKYKSYYVYDGSAYTDFYSLDTTNLSSYETDETSHSQTLYDTIAVSVPSTSSDEYVPIDRSLYSSTGLTSGLYKFVSAGWYVGTSSGCTYSTPYTSAAKPTADVHLYERMVCTLSNHVPIYVDTQAPQWTDAKIDIWSPISNIFGLSQNTFSGSGSFLSEVVLPNEDTSLEFLIFDGSISSPVSGKQTTDVTMNAAQWTAKGTNNTFEVYNTTNDNKYNWGWSGFYGMPSPNTSGYYLVGNNDFTGQNSGAWTLGTGFLMNGDTSDVPEDIADDVVAVKKNVSLEEGMSFKILHYETSNGKTGEWVGNNLETSDPQTAAIAFNHNGTDIQVCSNVSGTKFAIYLTTSHRIVIRDEETSTYIIFNDTPSAHSTKLFRMGYGDHTNAASPANKALSEQGVQITEEDIEDDLSFVIRDRRGGILSWYTYLASGDHGFSGDSGLVAQGISSSSDVYGDTTVFATSQYAEDGLYGFKITQPGYYKFYLDSDDKVSIAPMPGDYGEGYYIIPYNSSAPGSNKTDYYDHGIKMKEITNGRNLAVYTCYAVSASNMSIFFRCYRNGVDTIDDVTDTGNNTVYCGVLNENTYATMTDGVLTFKEAGAYNIYLFKDGNTVKVSIAQFTKESFFTLNSINKDLQSQDEIQEAKTGIVLEVGFTTANSNYNVEAIAEMVSTGSGASQYLDFTYSVITEDTDDNYYRYDNCYAYMYGEHYIGNGNHSPTNLSSGSHRMLILIDYDYDHLSSLPSTASSNDFSFVIKMRQTA